MLLSGIVLPTELILTGLLHHRDHGPEARLEGATKYLFADARQAWCLPLSTPHQVDGHLTTTEFLSANQRCNTYVTTEPLSSANTTPIQYGDGIRSCVCSAPWMQSNDEIRQAHSFHYNHRCRVNASRCQTGGFEI